MDNFPQLRKLSKRVMLSGYGIIVLIWAIITGFILYDYTISLFEVESTKWWTFVEAITEPLSFLPYRWDPEKNHFFQTLLFRGCITMPWLETNVSGDRTKDLCQIITLSPKEYEIIINSGFLWSDKTAITIDDVFFTYQHIIKENRRQQSYLETYNTITLTGKTENSFRISFPSHIKDHDFFFSLPILPSHALENITVAEAYTALFSREPITSTCVTLDTTTNDPSSLVFDMSQCRDNNINYYQLKSFDSDTALTAYLENNASKKFLSLVPGQNNISWYKLLPVYDDSFMTVFFNTQSARLTPRIQRAIAWYIDNYFRKQTHEWYLGQYTGIVNTFQSDGADVVTYIQEKNPRLTYDRKWLEQAWVSPLPESVSVDGINNKRAFFLPAQTDTSYSFSLVTDQEMPSIQWQSDKSKKALTITSDRSKKNHRITMTLWPNEQIQEWVNTITIKWKENKVVDIDIYYLGQTNTESETTETNKLKLVYYKSALSDYIIAQLEKVFAQWWLTSVIDIVWYDNIDNYHDILNSKEYDITLAPVRMSSAYDIATILSTNDPTINPSLSNNPPLINLFTQYANEATRNLENQIRTTMGTQMPFFILGQHNYAYHIRDSITFNYTGVLSLDTLRWTLLNNISLVSHVSVRGGKLIERDSLLSYIRQQKHITQPALTPDEDDSDDIDAINMTTGNESLLSGN